MRTTIRNVDLLLSLNPWQVAQYLQAKGWEKQRQIDNQASIWTLQQDSEHTFSILLPLDREFADFPLRLYEVVQTLENAEDRSQYEILGDLVTEAANIQVQGIITEVEKVAQTVKGILMGCAIGKFRKIQFELTATDYSLAIKAYQERLPIVCTGDLIKENNAFILKNLRDFTID